MERMVRERGGLKFHLLDDGDAGDGGMDTAKLNVDELDVDGNVQVCGVTTQAHMCTRDLTQKLSIELCWTLFKQLLAHVNAAIKQRR